MIAPGPGILLIAEPFLKDPNFIRTVVLLCEHQDQGSFGLVLNKQITQTLDELVPDLDGFPYPVFYGGPFQMNTLHFIHQCPEMIPGAVPVSKDIYWGGNFEKVKVLITQGLLHTGNIRFYVGYTGWSKYQLEAEIEDKTWIIDEMDPNYLFVFKPDKLWQVILENKGNTHAILGQIDDFLNLN